MNRLKYIGKGGTGDFIPGVPARDLTATEVEQYGGEVALTATGLYQKIEERPVEKVTGKEKQDASGTL